MVRLATRTWGEIALGDRSALGAAGGPDRRWPASDGHRGGAGLGAAARRSLAVLVHGVISSSRTWWRVAPALVERGFEVLTVDLRGHGASPPMNEGLGLPDLAADLAETVQAELSGALARGMAAAPRSPPVDLLIGHSLGALVVSQLLATRPRFARRLVLEDPPGISTTDWATLADGIEADGARARTDPAGLRGDLLAESPDSGPGEAERRVVDLAECDTTAIAAALRREVTYDLPGLVGSVQVPTLLLVGEEPLGSALVGPDRTALVSALDQGAVEVLTAGHNLHREAFDAFMAALDGWLAGTRRD